MGTSEETILIVGRGRVGRALHAALKHRRIAVATTSGDVAASRSPRLSSRLIAAPRDDHSRRPLATEQPSLVVLSVPDAAIADVATRVAARLPGTSTMVHCAGARTAEELNVLRALGWRVGAMHPMVSFASPKHPPAFTGTSFVLSGDAAAVRKAAALTRAVEAHAIKRPLQGPAYHALAALAANGAAALATTAVQGLTNLGATDREARRLIAGILHTVATNVEHVGVPAALSGPVRRGDVATVAAHRAALRPMGAVARAYDAILPLLIDVASALELGPAKARRLRQLLSERTPR